MSTPFDPGAQPPNIPPQGVGYAPDGFPPQGAPQPGYQAPPAYPQPGYPQQAYPQQPYPGYQQQPYGPYAQSPYGQMPFQAPPKKSVAAQPWLWIVIGVVAIGLIIGAIFAFGGHGNSSSQGNNPGANSDTPGYSLDAGWTFAASRILPYVSGYVSNDTDQDLNGFATIEFNAYDSQGANLGTCMDIITEIDAHGKWKFQAYCDSGTTSVKFSDLTITSF